HVNKRTQYERPQYAAASTPGTSLPNDSATVPGGQVENGFAGHNNVASDAAVCTNGGMMLAENSQSFVSGGVATAQGSNSGDAITTGVISSSNTVPYSNNALAAMQNRRHSAFYGNSNASSALQQHSLNHSSTTFTRDPSQLRGELITTRIVKGPKGLGFTLIGNDGSSLREEFLQIKSVLPDGPAFRDGILRMGDVLVYVNNNCVLGATQSQACRIFQSIPVGELVSLDVCRGYPLVLDPTHRIVTENAYSSRIYDEREIVIIKAEDGFGFTIFESMHGQRVKKILHPERCENLLEGDTLLEMRTTYPNGTVSNPLGPYQVTNFRGMSHQELVSVLRECPTGFWAKLLVRRNSPRHRFRSKTPTAGFRYGEQRTTPVPTLVPRSKTPLAQPVRPVKQHYISTSSVPATSASHLLDNGMQFSSQYGSRNTIPRQHERRPRDDVYEHLLRIRPSSTSLGFSTPNYIPMTGIYNTGAEMLTVNLIRKPTGFGFRVVGGSEVNTAISVGQIVGGGAAADDGRLRQGDEIMEIDGRSVVGDSHEAAVRLMQQAAKNGHVKLLVRRPKGANFIEILNVICNFCFAYGDLFHIFLYLYIKIVEMQPASIQNQHNGLPPTSRNTIHSHIPSQQNVVISTYDVVLNRNDSDGFGFVIISTANKNGGTIGSIMKGSPAAKCRELQVGDRVIAVNGIDIMSLSHSEIVNLIKDSGLSVRLTIAPPTSTLPLHSGQLSSIFPNFLCFYTWHIEKDCLPNNIRDNGYVSAVPQCSEAFKPIANSHCKQYGQNSYNSNDIYSYAPDVEPPLIPVVLVRGPKGFGFSIRGGEEFNKMPLFVLKIAENGPAVEDGRLQIGDQLMEINGHSTKGMTHATAIQIIKQFSTVKLLVRRPKIY
uniref:PDZ domain-containing protein n=1 Tax=Syphacia muris TaxID=451379 RepID=A0A0N5AHE7_9BILA